MGLSAALRTGLVTVVASMLGALALAAPPPSPALFAIQSSTTTGMSNRDVIMMVGAGLAEDVIITAIHQAPRRSFDLGPTGLIDLKLGHVPDAIVRAMQAAEADMSRQATPPRLLAPSASPMNTTPSPPSSIRPAPAPAPAPPPAPTSLREPSSLGELFGVAAATGGLTALERVRMLDKKVGGVRSKGMFKQSVQNFAYFFEGPSSPVTFPAGDPQVFVIRMMGPTSRSGKDATPEEVQKHFLLTRLEAEEGRRFLTKTDVQFDVKPYGRPVAGMDPKRPGREAASFQLTPRTVLAPGQYVILMAGTTNFEFVSNFNAGADRWAFAIVEKP